MSKKEYSRADGWKDFKHINGRKFTASVIIVTPEEVYQQGFDEMEEADGKIEWSSSNPSVAYANACGLIVPMGIEGSADIIAKVDGDTLICNVSVANDLSPDKVRARNAAGEAVEKIEPESIVVESIGGNPPMMNVRLSPVGSCTVLDWRSSDASLATIDHGIITMHGDVNSNSPFELTVSTANGLSESVTTTNNDITSGVETVSVGLCSNVADKVYDLTGRCVLYNADSERINALPKGIYIAGGKKVFVK